ncbi:MAG: NUDIX hydrolase [Turicibacter sp.]
MSYIKCIENYVPQNVQEQQDKQVMLDYLKQFPHNILTRENEFAHVTSSGFVMNETLDKVLMVYHNLYKSFAWTGGHADGDGDLLAVAIKEACEETGIKSAKPLSEDIMAIDILPVWGHMKKKKFVSSHLHLNVAYLLIASEDEVLQIKVDENSDVAWIGVHEIKTYCTEPDMLPIYEKLIEKAKRCKG